MVKAVSIKGILDMNKSKVYSCKVGTIPASIVLRYNYKIEVNKVIKFSYFYQPGRYLEGRITQVNSDGYFFVELI